MDPGICQTSSASPAEPGGLPRKLALRIVRRYNCRIIMFVITLTRLREFSWDAISYVNAKDLL